MDNEDLLLKVEKYKCMYTNARSIIDMYKKTLDEYINNDIKLRNTIKAQHREVYQLKILCVIAYIIVAALIYCIVIL